MGNLVFFKPLKQICVNGIPDQPVPFFPKKRIIDKAPPKKTIESKQYVFICFFGGTLQRWLAKTKV